MAEEMNLAGYVRSQIEKYNLLMRDLRDGGRYSKGKELLLETIKSAKNMHYDKKEYPHLDELLALLESHLKKSTVSFERLTLIGVVLSQYNLFSDNVGIKVVKQNLDKSIKNDTQELKLI